MNGMNMQQLADRLLEKYTANRSAQDKIAIISADTIMLRNIMLKLRSVPMCGRPMTNIAQAVVAERACVTAKMMLTTVEPVLAALQTVKLKGGFEEWFGPCHPGVHEAARTLAGRPPRGGLIKRAAEEHARTLTHRAQCFIKNWLDTWRNTSGEVHLMSAFEAQAK